MAEVAEGVEAAEVGEGTKVVEGEGIEKALGRGMMGVGNRGRRWAGRTTSRYVCVTFLRLLI